MPATIGAGAGRGSKAHGPDELRLGERLPREQASSHFLRRWFKSSLCNQKLFCRNKFRTPCNHPN
jgi:hypothetical protein